MIHTSFVVLLLVSLFLCKTTTATTLYEWCLNEVRCFSPDMIDQDHDPCSAERLLIDDILTSKFDQAYASLGLGKPDWLRAGSGLDQHNRQLGNLNCRDACSYYPHYCNYYCRKVFRFLGDHDDRQLSMTNHSLRGSRALEMSAEDNIELANRLKSAAYSGYKSVADRQGTNPKCANLLRTMECDVDSVGDKSYCGETPQLCRIDFSQFQDGQWLVTERDVGCSTTFHRIVLSDKKNLNYPIVLDTSNPGPGRAHLGSPNENCPSGGPGKGDGAVGEYENCEPQGKVLTGAYRNPNEWQNEGYDGNQEKQVGDIFFILSFPARVKVEGFGLLNANQNSGGFVAFVRGTGTSLQEDFGAYSLSNPGANGFKHIKSGINNTLAMAFWMPTTVGLSYIDVLLPGC